jgi:hypothetical protein
MRSAGVEGLGGLGFAWVVWWALRCSVGMACLPGLVLKGHSLNDMTFGVLHAL